MRVMRVLVACGLAVALAATAAGCVDTRPANAAIEAANAKGAEYTALDGQVSALIDEAGASELTPEGAKAGIAKLDEALALLRERTAVIADMRAEFASILEMDVPDEIREYARKQVAIADLLAQMDEVNLVLVGDTKALYELVAAASTDTAKAEELSARIDESAGRLDELDAAIAAAEADADAYFEAHDLGGS